MPQTTQTLLRSPASSRSAKKLRARIDRHASSQAVAATLSDVMVVDVGGQIQALTAIIGATPAAGESLVVDVLRNGVSILSAPYTFSNALPGKVVRDLVPVAGTTIVIGDVITINRTYTAGGGPTPIGPSRVILEVA